MNNLKLSYRPEIDGLRAIAVLSVILYHAKIEEFGKNSIIIKRGFLFYPMIKLIIKTKTF